MEVKGITLTDDEWGVYLSENGLITTEVYQPNVPLNKKKVYMTALSVLESVSNDINLMKNYVIDDMSVSSFHENLIKRIDQLQNKIDNLQVEDTNTTSDSSFFMLFAD
ncbi:hypothetical protein ACIQ4I_15340 [Rummeliibacillus sp. NPDC094406]|uniref:hypothetical protein n=1 Tax=Rummeliibacillus sp. NPDC094406 TaxID=3364511 RepID=UPI0037F5FAFF